MFMTGAMSHAWVGMSYFTRATFAGNQDMPTLRVEHGTRSRSAFIRGKYPLPNAAG